MPHPVFENLPLTIFEEMSALARQTGAINLGQGFPDEPGPLSVRQKAADESVHGYNQYPPMRGLPGLRAAVADHFRRHQGLTFNPDSEICITSGATEALAASILAMVQPGDDVIVLEPVYDAYAPLIRRAGGRVVPVRLEPPLWQLPVDRIADAITARTRFLILNNPVNPTGSVFPDQDLEALARLCVESDLVAICDEVWEQIVFAPTVFKPLMAYTGMRNRTIKIGSAGKMFALTGWKVGFICACSQLMKSLAGAHQFLTFTTAPNLQAAIAHGLETCGDWFDAMPAALARSRQKLAQGLEDKGFKVLEGAGTYFLTVDLAASGLHLKDRDFCIRAVSEHCIAAIPISSFYEKDGPEHLIRLCFAKSDAVLDEAIERLAAARAAFNQV